LHTSLPPEAIFAFQREWDTLQEFLAPVEYLEQGIFACEHAGHPGNVKPVWIWDANADLSEQTMITIADNLDQYESLRRQGENPFEITLFDRRRRQGKAEKELLQAIDTFNRFAEDFHQGYQTGNPGDTASAFEHDKVNRLPRYDDWKPERFCVHDHLMGVMGYRFNRIIGRLEVTGYATRDHTNYARGSATRSLLLGLLCEWAKQSANKGVVFVDDWYQPVPEPIPVPHEILVFARVLGVDIETGSRELSHTACRALFLKLTPFAMGARKLLETSDLSIKACLMVHKGIWTTRQIEDLIRYCPLASALFDGDIHPEQPLVMGMVMEHARFAVMAGISEQLVRIQAEEKLGSVEVMDLDDNLPVWPYSRLLSCNCDIELLCYENKERIQTTFPSGTCFMICSWPVTISGFKKKIAQVMKIMTDVQTLLQSTAPVNTTITLCLMIPAQAINNSTVEIDELPPGIHLTLMDETLDFIGQTAQQNIQQSRRLRK
jgi:hypothetical protein